MIYRTMSLTMQNALAVGETWEIIEKAELTTLKLHVMQLFTVWPTGGMIISFGLTGGVDPGTRKDD